MGSAKSSPIKSWLELVRLPNLFSVPGDPLAGLAFVSAGAAVAPEKLAAVIVVTLLLYIAGLVLNDLMDYKEDLADRPERPLPSGNIPVPAAWIVFALSCAVAIGITLSTGNRWPVFMAMLLLLCICLYNLGLKNIRVLGPVSMGACRGCSMLLGASMFGGDIDNLEPLVYAAYTIIIYISLLTYIADFETKPRAPIGANWLPAITLLAGLAVVYNAQPGNAGAYWAAGGIAVLMNVQVALRIQKRKQVIPPDIGGMIGALMFMQAAFLFLNGAMTTGVIIAALWPFNRFVVRRIYAS